MSHRDERRVVRPVPLAEMRVRRRRAPRRALVLAAALSTVAAAALGVADPASAAYTASVQNDTLRVTGDGAGDRLAVYVSGSPAVVQLDVGEDGTLDGTFDRATFSAVVVRAGGGNDTVRVQVVSTSPVPDEAITIDGGSGADTLIGSALGETLIGGADNDVVDGNLGADVAQLGSGNDTFQWDPGDFSDVVDGGDGTDTLVFNGSNIAEVLDLYPEGDHVRLTRNVASISMDLDGLERLNLVPRGGDDLVLVQDLRGTDARTVDVDAAAASVNPDDGMPDAVVVNGTAAADAFTFAASGGVQIVRGLAVPVQLRNASPNDVLRAAGLGGDDRFVLPVGTPGTGLFAVDGGEGVDTVEHRGTAGADVANVTANGTVVRTSSPGTAELDSAAERLVVNGLAGDDRATVTGNVAALTALTIDGGDGADTLFGGNGADTLIGGRGADVIDGNQGNDIVALGSENDTFSWDPGDGSDVVDGGSGTDAVVLNGSAGNENLAVTANGARVRLTRDLASITLDLGGIERTAILPRGGTDTIAVGDLTGTEVRTVDADLSSNGAGDAAIDAVVVAGTPGADHVTIGAAAGAQLVQGLTATVRVSGAEATDAIRVATLGGDDDATLTAGTAGTGTVHVDGGEGADRADLVGTAAADVLSTVANGTEVRLDAPGTQPLDVTVERVRLLGLGGDDRLAATGNLAALTIVTMDGGAGADTVLGSNGSDTLIGGSGNDLVDGQQGGDTALLGTGNDTFQWDPGDGSDTVEGQDGTDSLVFNGSNIGETFGVVPNGGGRVRVVRDIASITTDMAGMERATIVARGGADNVFVGDLTGTEMRLVTADLGVNGAGDGEADLVGVRSTEGRDWVNVVVDAGVLVRGLAAQTRVTGSDAALDRLFLETLGGDDTVTIGAGVAGLITPEVDLGADG